MPSSKEIQQKRLKHRRTKRAYDAHIKRFMAWYAQHKGDYEDENGQEPTASSPALATVVHEQLDGVVRADGTPR